MQVKNDSGNVKQAARKRIKNAQVETSSTWASILLTINILQHYCAITVLIEWGKLVAVTACPPTKSL